jgi:hypothetical protein
MLKEFGLQHRRNCLIFEPNMRLKSIDLELSLYRRTKIWASHFSKKDFLYLRIVNFINRTRCLKILICYDSVLTTNSFIVNVNINANSTALN